MYTYKDLFWICSIKWLFNVSWKRRHYPECTVALKWCTCSYHHTYSISSLIVVTCLHPVLATIQPVEKECNLISEITIPSFRLAESFCWRWWYYDIVDKTGICDPCFIMHGTSVRFKSFSRFDQERSNQVWNYCFVDIFNIWKHEERRMVAEWCLRNTGTFIVATVLSLLFVFLLSPLCRVFTFIYLKQTMCLGYIVLQLFCIYSFCYM